MAVIKIPTNFNIDLEFEVPEFFRRILALFIDTILLIIYYKISVALLTSIAGTMNTRSEENWMNLYWGRSFFIIFRWRSC